MNQLQKALTINAIFSGLSGVILVITSTYIAQLFKVENNTPFWIIGLALIFFSGTIVYEIKRLKPSGVLSIIIQDIIWVIGSIVLLMFQPFEISKTGNAIIAIIAFIVLLMAIHQAVALKKSSRIEKQSASS
ncbi:hypothetical protein [Winogradskyella sp. 3972H.M.0a.05]|uniref:hypothetical protein n=1 Tax=Winogradskyella sp. 3972H.M.0a.05 TaxID=2950277 RepID=UPI0033964828